MLRVVTLNILIDLQLWDWRGPAIVSAFKNTSPDIIALQEVHLSPNTAQWIAERLNGYQLYLAPDSGMKLGQEGLAILTRLPISQHIILDLGAQNRKAQVIHFSQSGQEYALINTHLFWQAGHTPERQKQAQMLLDYLEGLPGHIHQILCGDFNDTPLSPTIKLIKKKLRSAYEAKHGFEAPYTFPTPLMRAEAHQASLAANPVLSSPFEKETETIDYIFVSQGLVVHDARLTCDRPHPTNPQFYPSDHYGLLADISPRPLSTEVGV